MASLIKVPEWIDSPLGKYYLYFAHHKGPDIRMAYANTLSGPWKMYEGDVLTLESSSTSSQSQASSSWSDLRKYPYFSEAMAIIQVRRSSTIPTIQWWWRTIYWHQKTEL